MQPSVYVITCTANLKMYVGSSLNYRHRWFNHIASLRSGTHVNRHLQSAWNKYGEAAFEFEVVEITDSKHEMIAAEQSWMDWYRVCDPEYGFNKRPKAESNSGYKLPDETRLKMSLRQTGSKRHPSIGKKISEARRGMRFTDEHRANLKAAWKRRSRDVSDETRQKLSESQRGRRWPPGSRKTHEITHETRSKMTASRLENLQRKREGAA